MWGGAEAEADAEAEVDAGGVAVAAPGPQTGAKQKNTTERADLVGYKGFCQRGLLPPDRKILGHVPGMDIARRCV